MAENLGQHFLDDKKALADIVTAGDISENDTILEIGPGEGALTRPLLDTAAKVVAVEKDPQLVEKLEDIFKKEVENGQLQVLQSDIRDLDVSKKLKANGYKLVANIPYYLTGQLIEETLSGPHQPERVVLLVQKEVAERIVAEDSKESILSLSVKVFGTPEIVRIVDRESFSPPPTVDSAVLQITDINRDFFADIEEKAFFSLIKRGFSHKRKTLANNIATDQNISKEMAENALKNCRLKKKIRAERLHLDDWKCLFHKLI